MSACESQSWCSSLSTGVTVAQTKVVKHADEAANAYQIFIRPGEAVQLVKEDGKDGAPTPPTAVTVASPQPNSSSQTLLHL